MSVVVRWAHGRVVCTSRSRGEIYTLLRKRPLECANVTKGEADGGEGERVGWKRRLEGLYLVWIRANHPEWLNRGEGRGG